MRIVHVMSGAGAMYCGSCLQGNTLVAALCALGEDAILAPVYTPIRTDEEYVGLDRVFFGGINVYLQQKSALFRHTPWSFDRLFDRPRLLRWLGARAASTEARALGELTVSMLQGEEGRQSKELEKLLRWLNRDVRPDVVHLSNVLLIGMAREIRRQLGVPVVVSLSGEDIFLEKLPEPHYCEARSVLRQRAAEVSALVAMNRYYADFMAGYLAVDRSRIDVVPPGLNLQGHGAPHVGAPAGGKEPRTLTIGYLARICPDKGLHLLAEALELLVRRRDLPAVCVRAAGYLGPSDRPYLAEIEARLRQRGLADRFHYAGELSRSEKIAFLQSLDVMSLPTVYRESKGISVLEAWANGVPVVVPAHGAFPEMIDDTGGGLLAKPHDASSLAEALAQLICDPELASQCGRRAQQAVHQRYQAEASAQRMLEVYRRMISK